MATLLPNGKQQFFDQTGTPLAAGTVGFYIPNTFTPKDTWQDSGQTVLNTNPILLDAAGEAIIYGSGVYRQVVKDSAGNLIWDQITADTAVGGIAWGGVSTGTPNAQVVAASSFSQQDGQVIDFIAGFTNTGALTVAPGGGTGIPVLLDSISGPLPLSGGEVVADNAVSLIYEATRGAFHLLNPAAGAISSGTIVNSTITGSTISTTTITLKQATDPSPTAEGDMQWSTLYDNLKVGTGGSTARFWAGATPGALYGCTLANNASDPTNDIDFSAGTAVDSTNTFYMTAAALTKRLDATWAAGTNQGGLFSGVAANTTYHCFIIMRPDTGAVDAGFDTSVTAANRPAAYTLYRCVGSIIRSAGAILGFTQQGDVFTLSSISQIVNATNPGTSAITITALAPVGRVVQGILSFYLADSLASDNNNILVTPLFMPDTVPSDTNFNLRLANNSSGSGAMGVSAIINVFLSTSAQARYRLQTSDAGVGVRINSLGWIDTRGRLG